MRFGDDGCRDQKVRIGICLEWVGRDREIPSIWRFEWRTRSRILMCR